MQIGFTNSYELPERATISLAESPLALKDEISVARLDVGAGMLLFAAL